MKLTPRAPYAYRDDPAVPAFDDGGPRTVMDARCGLCAKGARWIAHNDRAGRFRIIPMQSPLGAALFAHFGLDPGDPASWLLIDEGRGYTSLDAIIRTGGHLGGWSAALAAFCILPRPVQDWGYGMVARNRYRLSARVDLCTLPDPAVQERLIL
ncbi:thiol-disulfide oxidoreductase DCC family protein [Ovoidimarina sediminis]|uniref:thiol-disulfide oxidoreductase DCC family protein n=1 Tax=Ovoidimarina sediminis TaxID=3079856 RepID=UPI002907D22A|nr:DCC1-like thiol-disulfide oxidoreductase family protein [Rhodophyticola sp. MJ-SS7]MDU8945097.1 DCC1-like thiol-disulfide oxidoreductase family protein [Rhodophyticola sp. MJ-SS7]